MNWKKHILLGMIAFLLVLVVHLLISARTIVPIALSQTANTPSIFYDFEIIAETGQAGLVGIEDGPSINDQGLVAFVGNFTGNTEAVLVGNGVTQATLIASIATSRNFGPDVQINNGNQVVAQDFLSGSLTMVSVWDANGLDAWTQIAQGQYGNNDADYDAVFSHASINNHGQTVFGALNGHSIISNCDQTCLATQDPSGIFWDFFDTPMQNPIYPVIADDGRIVAKTGLLLDSPIEMFDNKMANARTIADASMGFTTLGRSPGVSDDGVIVVFYGDLNSAGAGTLNTTPGPGIFACIVAQGGGCDGIVRIAGQKIEDISAPGGNNDGICNSTTTEVCSSAPELGYDGLGNPIYFDSFDIESRVGVVHIPLGISDSIVGDSFVVTFIARPNAASRDNPARPPGHPLLFSGEEGVWSIRIDVERQLQPPHDIVYHPTDAIPVIQVGDVINGNAISKITLYDPIANVATNDSGTIRTQRRGDHQIAFWVEMAIGKMVIKATHVDSDQDGLLDHWETGGIDMDKNGVQDLNLAAMGADPKRRDIFVEMDWLVERRRDGLNNHFSHVNEPAPGVTRSLVDMFKQAPGLFGPAYGFRSDGGIIEGIASGINLHIDAGSGNDANGKRFSQNMGSGPLEGGDKIGQPTPRLTTHIDVVYKGKSSLPGAPTGVETRSFHNIKDNWFGQNDKWARELAFHYIILADFVAFKPNNAQPFTSTTTMAYNLENNRAPGGNNDWICNPGEDCEFEINNAPGGNNDWICDSGETCTTLGRMTDSSTPFVNSLADLEDDAVMIIGGKGAGQLRKIDDNMSGLLQVRPAWTVIPDATSRYTLLDGDSGESEEFILPNPDFNSDPGNDVLITLGGFGVNSGGWLATPFIQWRTIAHELGHNLGLRHCGTHKDSGICKGSPSDYRSLMSYAHQSVMGTGVDSYSAAGDLTYDDWSNLQLDFHRSVAHLGNTFGLNRGVPAEPAEEVGVSDYEELNAEAVDLISPSVSIDSPTSDMLLPFERDFVVSVTATDNAAIHKVEISFDIDGDGDANETGETVQAFGTGPDTFEATFRNLARQSGPRTIQVSALDTSLNTGIATTTVTVEGSTTGDAMEPIVNIDSPTPGTLIPQGSDLTVSLTATDDIAVDMVTVSFDIDGDGAIGAPNETTLATRTGPDTYEAVFVSIGGPGGPRTVSVHAEDTSGNIGIANTTVIVGDSTDGNGAPTVLIVTPASGVLVPVHSDLTVHLSVTSDVDITSVTVLFDTDGNGTINRFGEFVRANEVGLDTYEATFDNISGPVGARLVRVFAVDSALNIGAAAATVIVADTTAPTVNIDWPKPGMFVPVGNDLTVRFRTTDDVEVDSVEISFDTNGDGTVGGSAENIPSTSTGSDTYEATLTNVSGPEGSRTIQVSATDSSLNRSVVNRVIRVGDTVPMVGRGISVPYEMIFGLGSINALAFSPDGQQVLLGGSQGFAVLVDTNTGIIKRHLFGHTADITGVAFSPDGTQVLTGSKDKTAKLWDATSGTLLRTFTGHTADITAVAFSSPDGAQVLTGAGHWDDAAWLWDTVTGEVIRKFESPQVVNAVAFSPDGTQILTGSADGTARLWDTSTGTLIRPFGHASAVTAVAFSPHGEQILTVSSDKTMRLWDVTTDDSFQLFSNIDSSVYAVAFSPDGTQILTGIGNTAQLWDATDTSEPVHTFEGHESPVLAVTFSSVADVSQILTGSTDGTIRIWDMAINIEDPITVTGHTGAINAIAVGVTPDGTQLLLTGGADHTVQLWNVTTGERIKEFLGHTGPIEALAISPDGSQILTAAKPPDRTVRLWDTETGMEIRRFEGHTGDILVLAFSTNGSQIFTGSKDGTIRLWDLQASSPDPNQIFTVPEGSPNIMAFSPDKTMVFTGHPGGIAQIWGITADELELKHTFTRFEGRFNWATDAAFSADGSKILISVWHSSGVGAVNAWLWDIATGASRLLPRTSNPVAFSLDGTRLLTTDGNKVQMRDAATGDLLRIIREPGKSSVLAFSFDGMQMIMTDPDGTIRLRNAVAGANLHRIGEPRKDWIVSVALSPDGTKALTGMEHRTNRNVRLWDNSTGGLIYALEEHSGVANAVAFSPDGTKLLAGGPGKVNIWDTNTGMILHTITSPENAIVYAVAFSSDGTKILTGDSKGRVQMWDPATEELLRTFEGHTDQVNSVIFSPDGTQVLSGGNDNVAVLWDANSGEILASFSHTNDVNAIAFSSDGSQVLTGGADGTARLWSLTASGQLTQTQIFTSSAFTSVAFSPDDVQVLTGNNDGKVRLWDAVTGQILRVYEGNPVGKTVAAYSADGTSILTGGVDGAARLWQVGIKPIPLPPLIEPNGGIISADWSPLNQEIVTVGCRRNYPAPGFETVRLWSAEGELLFPIYEDRGRPVCSASVGFSPDGTYILIRSNGVEVRDANNGQLVSTFPDRPEAIKSAVVSRNGMWVLTGRTNNQARLHRWNATTEKWEYIQTFEIDPNVTGLALSPDDSQVLMGSRDGIVRLLDLETGEETRNFKGHVDGVTATAYSPDGTRVVTGSDDRTVRLWDVATGTLLHVYNHPYQIKSVAFAPDKPWIVTTGQDSHTAYIWDTEEGNLIFAVSQAGSVNTAVFSPDGTQLLTGGSDGTARLWMVEE